MSFRDLRNLSEILRSVGYPRLVSLENFRSPNFALVADVGIWLVNQYEPKADFPTSIATEQERIIFIRTFAEFMLSKVQIKLNTKRLYQADGYAVKELIKVVNVLYAAMREAKKMDIEINKEPEKCLDFDLSTKMEILKRTRELSSEITQKGVNLFDLLSKEMSLREVRASVMSRNFEHSEMENLLSRAVEASKVELKKISSTVEGLKGNIQNVEGKLETKKQELERSEKRLLTLKKVRPAFMDEFDKLQGELKILYKGYVSRFRTLSFLQNQIEEMNRVDLERKAEDKILRQELLGPTGPTNYTQSLNNGQRMLNSSGSDEESDEDEEELVVKPGYPTKLKSGGISARPQAGTAASRSSGHAKGQLKTPGRQLYGSMLGMGEDSGESESDLLLVGENSDLDDEDEDDVDLDEEGRDLMMQNTAIRMARTVGNSAQVQEQIIRSELKAAQQAQMMNGSHKMELRGLNGPVSNGGLILNLDGNKPGPSSYESRTPNGALDRSDPKSLINPLAPPSAAVLNVPRGKKMNIGRSNDDEF